uniref:Peptidase M16 middle/third domain-containing protein n=1 Tax=Amphimedon queenslandica TaxID=400682 RepID=A0A1X7SVZ2_AMPQE
DECHNTAPWFNTKYNEEVVSLEWEKSWKNLSLNPELHLPHPNKFIASEFELLAEDVPQTKYPVIIKETPHYKIWYKKDDVFDLPKASICVSFVTPNEFQLAPETVVDTVVGTIVG